jgi:LuxR family transcriptional regulator, maltose regulon positive regulatory protein
MILRTKLHIPHAHSAMVERPALMQSLDQGKKTRLTMITAPAGYGKTTALTEWLKNCDMLVAWVSLDKSDNDFTEFWNYIFTAINDAYIKIGADAWPQMDHFQASLFEPMVTALINRLESLPCELVLILDDFHVIDLPSINNSMSYLLELLPPHIHLYIASRSELSFPTARLRARNQVHLVNVQDLRFELDEAVSYFQNCMGLPLSTDDISRLNFHTEGWISGLHLAALALKRNGKHFDFIHQFGGQQRDIAAYLLEEVFQQQSDQLQTFLLNTSILNRMNSSLCEAVTGLNDCQERLELLEQQNLFIVPLDEQRNWYRYHHLFADFLQRLLQKHPKKWAEAHENAARWLELHGFDEEAVECFIAGNYYSDAVRLIEKLLPTLLRSKWTVLHRWVTVIPEESIRERPMIEICYISVLISFGEWELAKTRAQQVEMKLQGMKDVLTDAEWRRAFGNLYWGFAMIAYTQRDLERAVDCLDVIEQYIPEGSFLQALGGNAAIGSKYDDMLAHINDLRLAETFIKRWVKTWEHKKGYRFGGYFYVSYSELMYEWNRLEEAEVYAERVLNGVEQLSRNQVRAAGIASRIQYFKGHPDIAYALLEEVKSKIDSPDYSTFMMRIGARKANLWLQQDCTEQLTDWLQTCGMSYKDKIPHYHLAEYLTLARALAHCAQVDKAKYLLEKLYRHACKEDQLIHKVRVLIVQSITLHRAGNEQDALLKLEEALYLAEPQGYIRSFIDQGSEMADLLSRYLNLRNQKHIRQSLPVSLLYVGKLLLLLNVNIQGNLSHSSILTEKETEILRLIEKGLSNKQIAECTHVTIGTVKTHIKNMYKKLNVNSRLKALQRGKELNLL